MLRSQLNSRASSHASSRIAARSPFHTSRMFCAIASASPTGPRRPMRSVTRSIIAPAATPTTGRPDACASTIETPKVSSAMRRDIDVGAGQPFGELGAVLEIARRRRSADRQARRSGRAAALRRSAPAARRAPPAGGGTPRRRHRAFSRCRAGRRRSAAAGCRRPRACGAGARSRRDGPKSPSSTPSADDVDIGRPRTRAAWSHRRSRSARTPRRTGGRDARNSDSKAATRRRPACCRSNLRNGRST